MDTAQWPQGIGLVKPMDGNITSSSTTNTSSTTAGGGGARPSAQVVERRARPQKEQALNCPRCNSTNTKFCYYNNYSLTQPRYFCKTCRRYWTEGGSLRNVPVGGGSRKNKKSSSSSSSASASTATTSTTTSTLTPSSTSTSSIRINPPPMSLSTSQNPKFHQGQDLNLAFPHPSTLPEFGDLPSMDNSSGTTNPSTSFSAMELLRSGMSARGLSPFIPMPMSMSMPTPEAGVGVYPAGFALQDFRPPTLSFPLDGVPRGGGGHVAAGASAGNEYGGMQSVQENAGRLLFPFEDLRQVPSGSGAEFEQNRGNQAGDPPGFWNAMMGGGGGGGSW